MSEFSRVAWKEGQFLLPQHFQQLERSMEAAFLGRWTPHSTITWGVTTLEFNEAALSQGRLELSRAQGILRDGTVFDLPSVDPLPVGRRLELRAGTELVEIFLALPSPRPNAPTTAQTKDRADIRFYEEEAEISDDLDPTRMESIDVATRNFRLLLTSDTQVGMVVLKLAEVRLSPEGNLSLSKAFIPPSLRVAASPALLHLCRDLVGLMSARAQSLAAERQQRYGRQSMEFSQEDVLRFWYHHTLNLNVNRLRHLVELQSSHPAEVYGELGAIVGSLSTFSSKPVDLPPLYRQEAIGACFEAVDRQIRTLLKLIFSSKYEVIPLTEEDGFWVGHIGNRDLLERGRFFLVVTPRDEVPQGEMSRLPSLFRMSVPDAINHLVAGGKQGGVDITPVRKPPSGLPAAADSTVYRVSRSGEHWERIRRSGQVAAWVPGWLPLRLSLIGELEREER